MSWNSLENFKDWYVRNKFPIRPPFEDPVYVTDISMSYVLYRKEQFQVELYLIKPNTESTHHSHPGVTNIIVMLGGDLNLTLNGKFIDSSKYSKEPGENGLHQLFGYTSSRISPGETHAAHVGNRGAAFLSFELWPDGVPPSSVTINWNGDPIDEEHRKKIQVPNGS